MNFYEFEEKMNSFGFSSLASIARALDSTPQAVSNWKARNQIPNHIMLTINEWSNNRDETKLNETLSSYSGNDEKLSFSDLINIFAEQLKVMVIVPFAFVFLTFIYVQFIQDSKFTSWAKVLVPDNSTAPSGGIAGIASQFGVNIPTGNQADLSSPAILPDLIYSRTFGEKILQEEIFSKSHGKNIKIFSLFTSEAESIYELDNYKKSEALRLLRKMIDFNQTVKNPVSTLSVTALDPSIAKDLADIILVQLDSLNRYYKDQVANEKITFIESRISSVMKDFEFSEKRLKNFNQQNRQISSPSLQLQLDRLERDVEIQKGIYLTLKQQLELAKIEKIQESSVIQIIDMPQIPSGKNNKNLFLKILLSGALGLIFSTFISVIRSNAKNASTQERKKIRRFRLVLRKKSIDFFKDPQISGTFSLLLLFGLPFFLSHESKNPIFFEKYSLSALAINFTYILCTIIFIYLFFIQKRKHTKQLRNYLNHENKIT
tara:strand:- start:2158 stop:3624 length:1467 start_codon:yes stop_codon:yes gene_type:complete